MRLNPTQTINLAQSDAAKNYQALLELATRGCVPRFEQLASTLFLCGKTLMDFHADAQALYLAGEKN